jgi:RNA polymerase sigma factor (sigma-70 family)
LKMVNLEIHKELIEKSKRGNSRAIQQLYKLYSKAMFNTCYRMMNHFEDAEDMLQESFTDAFEKIETFVYKSTFGAWLKKIVVNNCINELKRRKPDLQYFQEIPQKAEDKVETRISLSVEKVREAMVKLPEGGRVIFSLYLLEGFDHREISEILNISESTSKSQYMRAKRRINELLKKELQHEE